MLTLSYWARACLTSHDTNASVSFAQGREMLGAGLGIYSYINTLRAGDADLRF